MRLYDFSEIDPRSLGMARVGEQVRFLDRNGYDTELNMAREHFHEGGIATVAEVSIGGWSSSYRFEEHGRQWFNTVMFQPVAQGIEAQRAETPESGSVRSTKARSRRDAPKLAPTPSERESGD
jgi:hypothetical protein